jgi:hypothetical protein
MGGAGMLGGQGSWERSLEVLNALEDQVAVLLRLPDATVRAAALCDRLSI